MGLILVSNLWQLSKYISRLVYYSQDKEPISLFNSLLLELFVGKKSGQI